MVKDLSVGLCGLTLKNPVIPASGTFGFGLELADDMDLNVLGGISLKGTTREARYGNPTPRIAECPGGMINSVGLQNPGIDVLVNEKVPSLRKVYDGCIIANISGFRWTNTGNAARRPMPARASTSSRSTSPAPTSITAAWPSGLPPNRRPR